MIIRLKHFHDSLNTVVILTPGHEFFSAKCAQLSLALTECKRKAFSSRTVIISFFDIFYQKLNFKNHLNSVLLCK